MNVGPMNVGPMLGSAIGALAAIMTSLSYVPQVRKAMRPNSTNDLSLKMLVVLTLGLVRWVVYGAIRGDIVIITANAVGASLTATVLACKLRDLRTQDTSRPSLEPRTSHPVELAHSVHRGTITSLEDRP